MYRTQPNPRTFRAYGFLFFVAGLCLVTAVTAGCGGSSKRNNNNGTTLPTFISESIPTSGGAIPSGLIDSHAFPNVHLSVPAGGFTQATQITLQASSPTEIPTTAGITLIPNTSYDFGPTGTAFATGHPGVLSIKYDPTLLPFNAKESALRMYMVVGGAWQLITGSQVNTSTKIVQAQVTQVGIYAVLIPVAP